MSNYDKATRKAIRDLEAKANRNTGGNLLGKHMVHERKRNNARKERKNRGWLRDSFVLAVPTHPTLA